MKQGVEVLSDAELLAVILKIGTKEENVIDMCHRLISMYGLERLTTCSLPELQKIKGIGNAKACQIVAALELGRRSSAHKNENGKIEKAKDVYDYFFPKIGHLQQEQFRILMLDTKNKILKEEIISMGLLDASLVHPREVFKSAIKESAQAVIVVHNHPSGDPLPSSEDEEVTQKLRKAGEILGINVLDHVIIGKEYYSFKEKRKM